MILATPGGPLEARVDGFPTGHTGQVGAQIIDAAGNIVSARQTVGITESPAGSGSYLAELIAPNERGSYSVFWDTGVISPSTTASEDLTVSGSGFALADISVPPPDSQTPTLADVGELTRSRTKDTNGNELGTFTTDTRPTATQVTGLIEKAVSALAIRIGTNLPEAMLESARDVAALDVAMRVELSFFAEQVATRRSPYNELKALHDQALTDLVKALQVFDDQTGVEDPLAPAGMPVSWFPMLGGTPRAPGSECDHGWPGVEW